MLTEYPPGTFLRTENGVYYVVRLKSGRAVRYKVLTERVLESWNPHAVVNTSEDHPAVKSLSVLGRLKFRDGSLLYSQATGKMYLVSEYKLRHITNPDWLDHLGLRRQDAVWVSKDEINLHEEGDPLN
jgi:hypothetical protein